MDTELIRNLQGRKLTIWAAFLRRAQLEADTDVECTVLVWDGDELIATGSRKENLLKCIAVDAMRQGEGLTATVLTALRQDAFQAGYKHLFLYTKPKNKYMFSSLFFYPVAQTDTVLLMENEPKGITGFLESLPVTHTGGNIGAVVMNCNPFTLGHRYLIETAASSCEHLYVFVLSEDKSQFSAADRMALVKAGTADIPNVTVLPTGPYLISSATFPTYFLKDRDAAQTVQCLLDIEIFVKYYVPRFGITTRFVGTEPLSAMTDQYNQALKAHLPGKGITLKEVPRCQAGSEPISASRVRSLLGTGQPEILRTLVPETTFAYLQAHDMI